MDIFLLKTYKGFINGNNIYLIYGKLISNQIINENSDLKNLYLTREELQQKREPVVLTQDQLFSRLAK